MRDVGVPEDQLLPVAGGERIPLFTKAIRDEARQEIPKSTNDNKTGHPSPAPGPLQPDASEAAISVQVWPSLHCLMPGDPGNHPEVIDTATVYNGAASEYSCTIDITMGMRYGLIAATNAPPERFTGAPPDFKSFVEYMRDTEKNVFSSFDGGQLAFNFLIGESTLLWISHLGGYEGVLKAIRPRPDVVIMGIAGRGNVDGRPYNGSAAQCATNMIRWLGEPSKVIWCLQDEAPIKPKRIDTAAATKMVEESTRSRILELEHAKEFTM
jgi:hypothetical protein